MQYPAVVPERAVAAVVAAAESWRELCAMG